MPGISFEEAKDVAERIRKLIEVQRVNYEKLVLRVTVSAGFAQLMPNEDATSLTKRADAALYSSKEAGRNCVHFHDGTECHNLGAATGAGLNVPLIDATSHKENDPYCDETTGLPTGRVLVEELRRRTAERNRYGVDIVVAVVRVDEFAATQGSSTRRQKTLMATIARMIGSELRETDLVVRHGVDSFAILMPSTTLQGAVFPLRRICTRSGAYHDVQYPDLSYAVSIGASEVSRDESATTVLSNVDTALRSAVDSGGGRLVFFAQNGHHVPVPIPAS